MSEFNNLKLDVENEIAVLTISRPAALNALNSETLDELNTALTEIEGRDDIKVVILTGGPDKKDNAFKSFVAGADIAEMVNFTAPEARAFGIRASVPFFKLMNMRQFFMVLDLRLMKIGCRETTFFCLYTSPYSFNIYRQIINS